MQKLWIHIQLHAMTYMVPLVLVIVLSVGGVGVAVSGIPLERVKWQALKTFILVAKAMTKSDPLQQSNELVKLEGRRRKNGWKDTHEEQPWNHRFMEEGTVHDIWKKYRVKQPCNRRRRRDRRAIRDLYVKMEISIAIIMVVTILFMFFVGRSFSNHMTVEMYNYFKLIGRI